MSVLCCERYEFHKPGSYLRLAAPNPRGTRNHPHEAALKKRPHFGWLRAPVESGDRAKRCLSEG